MELRLLGTGAPDGLPRPRCGCRACLRAAADGVRRGPTAALLGDRLLLDTDDATGLGEAQARLASGGPGHLTAGRRRDVEVGGFDVVVRALAAGVPNRVVLDVVTGDGGRVLWAPVTGPLPARTVEALAGAAYGTVVLGVPGQCPPGDRGRQSSPRPPGRSRLTGFAHEVARLRAADAVVEGTDVVAVGIDDGLPAQEELAPLLAQWAARAVPDGTVLAAPATRSSARAPARPAGHRRTLVLGGSGSGKSAVAEDLLAAEPDVLYLATGALAPSAGETPDGRSVEDAEWAGRIAEHRDRRPPWWHTIETSDAAQVLAAGGPPVLLDSVGSWLAAAMERAGAWADAPGWRDRVEADADRLIAAWRQVPRTLVAVSEEVGWGAVPTFASGRRYADALGRLNQRLAAESERVLLVVAGRALDLRTGAPGPALPVPERRAAGSEAAG